MIERDQNGFHTGRFGQGNPLRADRGYDPAVRQYRIDRSGAFVAGLIVLSAYIAIVVAASYAWGWAGIAVSIGFVLFIRVLAKLANK